MEVRHFWLQDQLPQGCFTLCKVPWADNSAYVLTYLPAAGALQKSLPELGSFPVAAAKGAYELVKAIAKNNPAASGIISASLLPFLAEGATQEEEYDIYDFMKEMALPIVIGIMTVVGAVTSLRTVAQMVGRCTCRKKHCSDKAVQTIDPATEIIYPDNLWVTRAGERYHSDHHCSGFKLHKVTPCSFCVPRKLASSKG